MPTTLRVAKRSSAASVWPPHAQGAVDHDGLGRAGRRCAAGSALDGGCEQVQAALQEHRLVPADGVGSGCLRLRAGHVACSFLVLARPRFGYPAGCQLLTSPRHPPLPGAPGGATISPGLLPWFRRRGRGVGLDIGRRPHEMVRQSPDGICVRSVGFVQLSKRSRRQKKPGMISSAVSAKTCSWAAR